MSGAKSFSLPLILDGMAKQKEFHLFEGAIPHGWTAQGQADGMCSMHTKNWSFSIMQQLTRDWLPLQSGGEKGMGIIPFCLKELNQGGRLHPLKQPCGMKHGQIYLHFSVLASQDFLHCPSSIFTMNICSAPSKALQQCNRSVLVVAHSSHYHIKRVVRSCRHFADRSWRE